jgi:CRISPR-associated protein Cmr2
MSTSHVAALPLLQQLAQRADTARDAWDRYLTELRSSAVRRTLIEQERIAWKYPPHPVIADYDGSLLFEERLDDVLAGAPPGDIQGAKGALRDFLRATLQEGTSPLPYYALLHADGDNMGKVIDAIDTLERHQELSRNLSIFAGKVRTIVENDHAGALIYAGGDDVLALVPLHTALPCADHLARTFYEQLQQFTAPNDEKTGTISPTLSVGIAVWHHIEPLADALDLVRQAEKQAKDVHRKNALAVTLSKRSGADRTVAGSWGNPDTTDQQAAWGTLYQRLLTFVELHRREAFPDGAAYELHDLYLRVGHTLPPAALQAEAMRMLQRKRAQKGITGIDAPMLEQIAQVVSQPDMTLEQLANEIIIARIFADADRLAYPDKVQPATLDTKEQS